MKLTSDAKTAARRTAVVVWPVAVAAILLASCGSDSADGPTRSTIELSEGSTAFVVRPPVTTTTAPEIVVEDGVVEGSQEYIVQAGDYPYKLVQLFDVPLEDLINFNGWADENEFPGPGSIVKIPPGAKSIDAAAGATETETATPGTDTDSGSTDDATATADTIPATGDGCAAGSYPIEADDVPLRVADKFDVTVEALNQANASTSGYGSFYVGLVIVIPPKADC